MSKVSCSGFEVEFVLFFSFSISRFLGTSSASYFSHSGMVLCVVFHSLSNPLKVFFSEFFQTTSSDELKRLQEEVIAAEVIEEFGFECECKVGREVRSTPLCLLSFVLLLSN